MTRGEGSKQDIHIYPTEEQLGRVSILLRENIARAIARAKLLGTYDDAMWEFEIEGCEALVDHEGYTRDPSLKISLGNERWDTPTERSYVVGTCLANMDILQFKYEAYRVMIQKNTGIVTGVARAIITDGFVGDLLERSQENFGKLLEDPEFNSLTDVASEVGERTSAMFGRELDDQMMVNMCNSAEVSELLEVLGRSQPANI